MGAWGNGPFDNDDAGDWMDELVESIDFRAGTAALDVGEVDYLGAYEGSAAIAASEVVAAALGVPGAELPDEISAWLESNRSTITPAHAASAIAAIDVVLGDHSELRELWEEGDENDEHGQNPWHIAVRELRARLESTQ